MVAKLSVLRVAPFYDLENTVSASTQDISILVCDHSQWAKAKHEGWEDKTRFAVEVFCSETEYNGASTLARTDRQFRSYDILGRRYRKYVQLFADSQGQVSDHLFRQYESQHCRVEIIGWPQTWEQSLPTVLTNAFMAQYVSTTGENLEYGFILHGRDEHGLIEQMHPHRLDANQDIMAVIRKNHLVWCAGVHAFTTLVHDIEATRSIHLTISNKRGLELGRKSNFDWIVPLTAPTEVSKLQADAKPTGNAKNRKNRKKLKAKLLQTRHDTINIFEEKALDWLVLPNHRRITDTEMEDLKAYLLAHALVSIAARDT